MAVRAVLDDTSIDYLLKVDKPVEPEDWRQQLLPPRRDSYDLRASLDLGELPSGGLVRGALHIYSRQNLDPAIRGDWSVGLVYTNLNNETYRIVRCNGPHPNAHVNHIEKERLPVAPHVHVISERYQRGHRQREDGFAVVAQYTDIQGALEELATRVNLVPSGRLLL